MPDLRPLIAYLVDQVIDLEGALGKTALVKLVYLLDVEHYRRYGTLATGLKWRFHHYGPYTEELEAAIRSNPYITVAGDNISRRAYRFGRDESWREIYRAFRSQFGLRVEQIAERIVADWGEEPLVVILNYVYFETEPMQNARRGAVLDFSTIPRETLGTRDTPVSLSLPKETLSRLHQRMKQRKEEKSQTSRPMTPPVYGDDYHYALRLMYEEEHIRYPDLKHGTKVDGPVQE